MSSIQPLKFRTLKTGCLKMPRFQTPRFQTGVFQTVVTVACGLCLTDCLSSILRDEEKSLGFHEYGPKGLTNFKCRKLKLHTLNYVNIGWAKQIPTQSHQPYNVYF